MIVLLLLILITMATNEKKIFGIIEGSDVGRTITEIVALSRLPRSVVRIVLARLEGGEKILFRRVGMAKIYMVVK